MTPLTALFTGLTTGGLTCLAVQGGLLFGLLARRQEERRNLSRWQRLFLPVSGFLIAKIAIYTLLGFGLGFLGEKIQLSTTAKIWLQTLAGAFMVLAGIRLVFPQWLPWLHVNPPAAIRRLVRRSARSEALAAPMLLGLLTLLIPCGTTQAMEVAAIATGSPIQAAAIMFAFTLGTAPLFLIIGLLAKGTAIFQTRLKWAAAALVIGLGVYSLNGVLVMIDSPYSIQNEIAAFKRVYLETETSEAAEPTEGSTEQTIAVLANGYSPNTLTVPAGRPVKLSLETNGVYGCTSVFRIPKLRIDKTLPPTGTTTIAATFPKPGTYTFSCGMGMYSGTINAI